MGMDFIPLPLTEREKLIAALRGNAEQGKAIMMNAKDTSFSSEGNESSDEEVIAAIKSVPCHY